MNEEPHDLPQEFTAREKRSLGVRAHLRRLYMETFGEKISAEVASVVVVVVVVLRGMRFSHRSSKQHDK